jgi:hypothetical protein
MAGGREPAASAALTAGLAMAKCSSSRAAVYTLGPIVSRSRDTLSSAPTCNETVTFRSRNVMPESIPREQSYRALPFEWSFRWRG